MRWEIQAPWPSPAEVERRFDELLRRRWGAEPRGQTSEQLIARELRIELDLPGLSEQDVDVRLEGRELIVEEHAVAAPSEPPASSTPERSGGLRHRLPLPENWEVVSHEIRRVEGKLSVRVRARSGEAS